MLQAVLLGGLFSGILSALPVVNFGNCCCLWILGGGALAAYLDQQSLGRHTTAGRGALIGLAAGVAGAFVWLIASLLIDPLIGPMQQRLVGEFLQIAQDVPPEVRDSLESIGEGRSPIGYLLGFVFTLCLGSLFSAIGGALAGAFFRNDVPPALGGPPPLP
jgi:uncharacterized protein YqgC (DUF456 family)